LYNAPKGTALDEERSERPERTAIDVAFRTLAACGAKDF
jgi:hypothetical protein